MTSRYMRLTGEHVARAGRVFVSKEGVRATRAEAWAALELRNMSRPEVGLDWWDETTLALHVSWGHPGSDPVWQLGAAVRLPLAVADWLGRHNVGS